MNGKDFIRALEEAMLKIELSNKHILFMHPEDIAILDLDKVSNAIYLVEERRLEHGKVIAITDEEFKKIVWDAIKNNKVKYHRGKKKMRLKPVVKVSEFVRFGFKPCRGLPKSAESYYLCVKNGHRVMFVDSKHFTETEWPIKDARIHKNPNCKFSDKRTATEIECELVVNGLLEEVRE